MIEYNRVGKIIAGQDAGQFVKVVPDVEDSGGYYILQSASPDFCPELTFDAWVESEKALLGFFVESEWKIVWDVSN